MEQQQAVSDIVYNFHGNVPYIIEGPAGTGILHQTHFPSLRNLSLSDHYPNNFLCPLCPLVAPTGTGKTMCVCEAIIQVFRASPQTSKILVCAPSDAGMNKSLTNPFFSCKRFKFE
jgi:hypothetical protein